MTAGQGVTIATVDSGNFLVIDEYAIVSRGGDAAGTGSGGMGGAVTISGSSVTLGGSVVARGGDAEGTLGGTGGNGNTISVTATTGGIILGVPPQTRPNPL